MSVFAELTDLLVENPKASCEVKYVVMTAVARDMDAQGFHDCARDVHRSASTLVPMFEGGAGADWAEFLTSYPWYRRMFISKEPPAWFKKDWSAEQTALGRDMVAEVLMESEYERV